MAMDVQINEVKEKAEAELLRIEQEYKEKKKEIRQKKNEKVRKYKESEALKLGMFLCRHFKTFDSEKIKEQLNLWLNWNKDGYN